jgi:6-phosphogluconolactonase
MASPHLLIVQDAPAVAHAALRLFVDAAVDTIEEKGSFSVALSGGSTPKLMFELLARGEDTATQWPFDWSKVKIFFGDERCVPPDHPESNYRMAKETLLDKVPIEEANVHRMKGEIDPNEAAKEYGELLKQNFADGGLDFVMLGMGEDGHTASLFPYSAALAETEHRCVAHYVEHSTTGKSWRITLTIPFLNKSKEIAVLVSGAAKSKRLQEVLHGPRDPQRMPIQSIQPAGKMVWIIDKAAAANIGQR